MAGAAGLPHMEKGDGEHGPGALCSHLLLLLLLPGPLLSDLLFFAGCQAPARRAGRKGWLALLLQPQLKAPVSRRRLAHAGVAHGILVRRPLPDEYNRLVKCVDIVIYFALDLHELVWFLLVML